MAASEATIPGATFCTLLPPISTFAPGLAVRLLTNVKFAAVILPLVKFTKVAF